MKIELPNERWVRATGKQYLDHALCLDAHHTYFGWVMKEFGDEWVPVRRLSREEVVRGMEIKGLAYHGKELEFLLDTMQLRNLPWDQFYGVCKARMRQTVDDVVRRHMRKFKQENAILNVPPMVERGR